MKKFYVKKNSREQLSSPYSSSTYRERLLKSHAVDLKDNIKSITIDNNFVTVIPNNPHKYIK